jgi:hypothetical protein
VVHRDGTAIAHLGPRDSFGERGLLDHAPRNATVTTEVDTTLLRVEGHALLDALEAAPALRPALDLSHPAPAVPVPSGETAVVDDAGYVSEENFARADTGKLRLFAPLAKDPGRIRWNAA